MNVPSHSKLYNGFMSQYGGSDDSDEDSSPGEKSRPVLDDEGATASSDS